MSAPRLSVALVVTIHHDGKGGVADDLETTDGLTAWVREHTGPLGDALDARAFSADPETLTAVTELRAAVRTLFAHAVRTGTTGPVDTGALGRLNAAARAAPGAPRLEWPEGGAPAVRTVRADAAPERDRLLAALAGDAIALLGGEERKRLRACPAPRCVRYFVKEHARQEWCKPSCGNRARVARHHRRHRAAE
ncbi:CGNR zinc finger domain-containing protein [Streptomyces coffeae]|uniref:ABATE domain-containing protein n=1 Tax=Streptomyces coffeae TaxID=621382 RepID=A0ABS1NA26_9ACTN|nr:CGNR zinc finger domain-containing protein [Streptomyces coffeae]MBL1096802.1 ABATE domain-containing protein [Streptomyces coffeae]